MKPFAPDAFTGRVAVVTGGTSGLGHATSIALAQHGAVVYAAGLGSAEVDYPDGLDIRPREVDVTSDDDLRSLYAELDQLDVLVTAAGVAMGDREMEWDAFNRVLSIQLQGVYRTINLAEELLLHSKGTVINFASMYAFFGGGRMVAYAAAKGGVVQLTKSLAEAWGPAGVRVNAVAPGWFRTKMAEGMSDEANQRVLTRTPMGRFGEPTELARAILFLASDAASFVNGVTLPVDGGYLTTAL